MREKINAILAWINENTVWAALWLFVAVGVCFVAYLNIEAWEQLSTINKALIVTLPVVSLTHSILHAIGVWNQEDANDPATSDKDVEITALRSDLEASQAHANDLHRQLVEMVSQRSSAQAWADRVETERDDLYEIFGDLIRDPIGWIQFMEWISDEHLDEIHVSMDESGSHGFNKQMRRQLATYTRESHAWKARRDIEERQLQKDRGLARVWMRRLMHQIFFSVGCLNLIKGINPEVRHHQDQMILKVLEALVELIPAHRRLYDDTSRHSYGKRWCIDLDNAGVRYALALNPDLLGNRPEDISKILRDLQTQKGEEFWVLLRQFPDDVYRFLTGIMIDPGSIYPIEPVEQPVEPPPAN